MPQNSNLRPLLLPLQPADGRAFEYHFAQIQQQQPPTGVICVTQTTGVITRAVQEVRAALGAVRRPLNTPPSIHAASLTATDPLTTTSVA